jgi:hypothetical protein
MIRSKSRINFSIVFLGLLLFNSIISTAQGPLSASWLRHSCGYTNGVNLLGGDVWGDAVCADRFGNSYNSGPAIGYWFTMDTVIELNTNRFYINKYDPAGNRLWTAMAKGTTINSILTPTRMKCDSLGNVYVCGTFSVDDSVYMAPHWYPVGSGIIAKYDNSGNNVWCTFIPRTGTTAVSFTDMALANGKIYVCGNMGFGTQSIGSFTFNSSQSQNGVIVALDLNGNVLAAEQLDPGSVNEIHGIEVSKATGDIYLVGQHISSALNVDGQTLNLVSGATNSFIVRMDSSLSAIWLKKCDTYLHINQTVGSSVPCLRRIELDNFDNIYAIANGNGDSTVIGSLSFAHRISPNGNYAQDIYIVKLDTSGQELWLRHGGSNEMDVANDLIVDEHGNSIISVYSGSQSVSGLIFGTDTIQQWHGGLVKYDTNGNLLYAKKLQEARSLRSLALLNDSVFFGTGTGYSPGQPYLNLFIPQCEDTANGYYNPPFMMVMAKFEDTMNNSTTALQNDLSDEFELKLYPNPVNDVLTVVCSSAASQKLNISIFGIAGNLVHSSVFTGHSEIDVSSLLPGLYFVKADGGLTPAIRKFIKH